MSPIRAIGALAVATVATVAIAADGGDAAQPIRVSRIAIGDEPRLFVEWPADGATIERTPDRIEGELREALERLKSGKDTEALRARARAQQEAALAAMQTAAPRAASAYLDQPQRCPLGRSGRHESAVVAIQPWMEKIPTHLRLARRAAFFDAADDDQRRWASRVRRVGDTQLFALGWDSRTAVAQWQAGDPTLAGLLLVPSDPSANPDPGAALAQDYGVTELPALVTFPDAGHARVEVGVLPEDRR